MVVTCLFYPLLVLVAVLEIPVYTKTIKSMEANDLFRARFEDQESVEWFGSKKSRLVSIADRQKKRTHSLFYKAHVSGPDM